MEKKKFRVIVMNHYFDDCVVAAETEAQANEMVREALSNGSFWNGMSRGTWYGKYWEVDDNATEEADDD